MGSAFLTTSGFGENTELVHEYVDDGMAAAWFARQWKSCDHPTSEWPDEHERLAGAIVLNPKASDQMPPPSPSVHPLESWSAFYGALLRADKQWAVKYGGETGVIVDHEIGRNPVVVFQ
jgi:hypothetical protein